MTNQLDTAFLVTILASAAIYLCLSRRFLRMLLGFLLLSNAANLTVLAMSRDPSGKRPAIGGLEGLSSLPVDPLPQAVILTAIVIGFSVAAYLSILLYRIYVDTGSATTTGIDDPKSAADKAARKGPR